MKNNKIALIVIFIICFIIGYCSAQPPCANSCTTCPANLVCIGCNCQTVAPIELIDYSCKVEDNSRIKLTWSTASETNNQEFQIFRSFDLVNYTKIATIPGAGNSTIEKSYEFIDFKPFRSINYYKLVQRDYDGSESVLKLINCSLNEQIDYAVTYTTILGQNVGFNELSNGWYIKEYSVDNVIVKREIFCKSW